MGLKHLNFEDKRYILGLDLGQALDYTSLSIHEQVWLGEKYEYRLRYLDRCRGIPYPEIVTKVSRILKSEKLIGFEPATLVLDKTGVGAPIADLFRAGWIRPVEITITGGQTASAVPGGYHVPKRDLVFSLLGIYQSGRYTVANGLKLSEALMNELSNFTVKINDKGNDTYESWRDSVHDDLVLSCALAIWYAEYRYGRRASSVYQSDYSAVNSEYHGGT